MPSITSPEPATDIHNDPEWEDIDGNQGWAGFQTSPY
jgi:hypothetical protein